MATDPFDLQHLRRRLDAIDERVHDLLIERTEIVSLVAAHKRTNNLGFYRPDREAEIIRRLVARHRGALPATSLVRIWRELLAASVSLEVPFAVAAYAPEGSTVFRDLARDHYGAAMPIVGYGSIGQVIRAVAEAPDSAGVLPVPQDGEPEPWWPQLLSQDRQTPRIIVRLPFGPCGNVHAAGVDGLVIGHGTQQNTGYDRTLVAIETTEISRSRLLGTLAAADLDCTFFASAGRGGGTLDLIELDGFVPPADPRFERFRGQLGAALDQLLPLGGYAVPLPAASVAAAVGPAAAGGGA
jgi:chorismate mutase-like protein